MACCVECPTFMCLQHILPHLRDAKHYFAVSLEHGYLYCLRCGDFVYDRMLQSLRLDAYNKYRRRFGLPISVCWNPTDEDLSKLAKFTAVEPTMNVRGIVNMGNTCFMNCILQCLVHSPTLRDFFLCDQHRCTPTSPPNTCIVCEFQHAFQFFYNGVSNSSLVPSSMLHLVWTRSHLAGYKQHDAHEFFITAIEMLHKDSRTNYSYMTVTPDCKCVIDQLFAGKLQSDLKCSVCGDISTKVDPFWDISVNLSPGARDAITLEKCLELYVSSEVLESALPCTSCDGRCPQKQLCFHFPEKLDMTPYTSDFRSHPDRFDQSQSPTLLNRKGNQYTLFGVVQHEGSLDSGHYTAFVRSANAWYFCDDEKIRQVSIERVLAAEAYILFYHITHLRFR